MELFRIYPAPLAFYCKWRKWPCIKYIFHFQCCHKWQSWTFHKYVTVHLSLTYNNIFFTSFKPSGIASSKASYSQSLQGPSYFHLPSSPQQLSLLLALFQQCLTSGTKICISYYGCATNFPKTWGLATTHLLSLVICVGHEFRKVSARKLSFGISRVISVRCLLEFHFFNWNRRTILRIQQKNSEAKVNPSQAIEWGLHEGIGTMCLTGLQNGLKQWLLCTSHWPNLE